MNALKSVLVYVRSSTLVLVQNFAKLFAVSHHTDGRKFDDGNFPLNMKIFVPIYFDEKTTINHD
jgi:hypothetical protein